MDKKSFWLICNEADQCHCDWRVTIKNCVEGNAMFYIYIINAIFSFIAAFLGGGILIHRVVYKEMSIFDYTSPFKYFVRPKPIESMLLFGVIFNFLRAIDAALIVSDTLSNNIFRALLYELPWQFGICAFTCYLFGIAHTVSHSSKVIRNNWFKSSIKIDISCTAMITLPFISNNICSIAAAIYAERGDFVKAKLYTNMLYFFWTAYCFTLASWIIFAGLRLLKILRLHLDYQHDLQGSTVHKIQNGTFKVKMIMTISATSLLVFSFIKCMYGLYRVDLLMHSKYNMVIACFWTFDGTLASLLVAFTLLITPKALSPLDTSSEEIESTTKSGFRGREMVVPDITYHGEYPTNFDQSGVSEAHLLPLSQDRKV